VGRGRYLGDFGEGLVTMNSNAEGGGAYFGYAGR